MAADGPLNVIALVSGGKDSFFSALHCLANGHRVVALANLHPPSPAPPSPPPPRPPPGTGPDRPGEDAAGACQGGHLDYDDSSPWRARAGAPVPGHGSAAESSDPGPLADSEGLDETDLNSFMYQTVGHQVVPLYAAATGLPLYRRPISGTAVDHGASYQEPPLTRPSSPRNSGAAHPSGIAPGGNEDVHCGPGYPGLLGSQDTAPACGADTAGHEDKHKDETESLVPLLRIVMAAHPEANALCTGAILSTYQRTRVESVALRLGLVPLAYLWQYPALPLPACPDGTLAPRSHGHGHHDDAQLLRDMAAVGLDARIIKVASAGLDEDILWQNVASEASIQRIQRALRRFGGGGRGSVLGEGGEFETLVVDGPRALFTRRIVVPEDGKRIVREGGGSLWLGLRQARVDPKPPPAQGQEEPGVRIPGILDSRFEAVVTALGTENHSEGEVEDSSLTRFPPLQQATPLNPPRPWCFVGGSQHVEIAEQTAHLVADIRQRLESQALPATAITNSVILLRHMSDFPAINKLYGALFPQPNPPARVTVACGTCLPAGCDIVIYLIVQPALLAGERQGLHVQSRSYWAPANIGPYSQAVGFPIDIVPAISGGPTTEGEEDDETLLSQGTESGTLQAISIAGQIPLVPASMALPQGSGDSATAFQVALALQHLWRVGAEMRVQWWTSAAAYFPRTASPLEMKHQALLAGRAWEAAHVWSPVLGDDNDENGPDLWDRKFNPQYMSLADGDSGAAAVPDWEVIHGFDADADDEDEDAAFRRRHVPFAFAAEVDELPRAAGVEWHAHLGLARADVGSVRVARTRTTLVRCYPAPQEDEEKEEGRLLALHHVVARSATAGGGVFVHTTAALAAAANADASTTPPVSMADITDAVAARVDECLRDLLQNPGGAGGQTVATARPYLSYAAAGHVSSSAPTDEAMIPCHTLWDSRGSRLSAVLLFQTHYNVTR